MGLLCGVTETGKSHVRHARLKPMQEPSDGLRAPDRHNGNALSLEVATTTLGKRLQGVLIADAFDEDNGARIGAGPCHWE